MITNKQYSVKIFLSIVLLIVLGGQAMAKTTTWTNASGGAWTTAGNWNNGVPSGTTDDVILIATSAAITAVPTITVTSLTVNGTTTLTKGGGGTKTITAATLTVATGVTLTLSASTGITVATLGDINGTGVIGGAGIFILNAGATLKIANTLGIVSAGATGAIQTTTRTFTTGASYEYDGTSAQVTGSGLAANTPANLTINNAAGVTLSAATTISGLLSMNAGTLDMANTNMSVGSLTGSTNLTHSAGTAGARVLSITGSASPAAYSGIISNGTATSVGITKSGTGTLTLSGNNTYTGVTTISAGTLKLGISGTALGTVAGNTSVTTGATLDLNGFTLSTAEPLTLNGSGSGTGALINSSVLDVSYSGLLNLGSTSMISTSGGGNINITNVGTILGSGNNLVLTGTGSNSSIASIIGTGAGTLAKSGTGTWTLSGNNTYTGSTAVTAGTLKLGISGTALGTVSGNTSVSLGATLDLNGFTLSTAEPLSLNGSGVGSTAGALANTGAAASYSGAITLGSASTILSTGDITVSGAIGTAGFDLTLSGTGANSIASGIISNNGTLTKTGTGTWTLSGVNTFTGATAINAGTIKLGTANALLTTDVTVAGSSFLDLNNVSGSIGSLAGAGTVTSSVGTNPVLSAGAKNTTTTFSGIIQNGSATSVGLIKLGTGTLTLSGNNTYSGATTVSAGMLQLGISGTAPNGPLGTTGAGTTVANFATLDLNGFTLSTAEPLSLNGAGVGGVAGALANLGGVAASYSGDISLGSASTIVSTRDITVSGAIANGVFGLTLGGTGTNSIVSGIISGATVTKSSTGTWTLSGNNTYTGTTTISSGTIRLGAAGDATNTPLGTITNGTTVANNAILDLNGFTLGTAEPLFLNGNGGGTGALINSSVSASTYTGLLTLQTASTINTTGGNINITNAGTISGAGLALTLSGIGTSSSISSIIGTGTGILTKSGTGTWALSGANTFSGAVTISAGTLSVNSVANAGTISSLGTGSTTPVISIGATGILQYTGSGHSTARAIALTGAAGIDASGSGTLTLSGGVTGTQNLTLTGTGSAIQSGVIATSTGTVTKTGTGTWTLSGVNTFTGTLTVTAGIVQSGVTNGLSSSMRLTMNGGTYSTGATTGFGESAVGTFALTDNSTFKLGTGSHSILFAASNGVAWTSGKMLTITGWTGAYGAGITGTGGKLFIGTTSAGLTATQVAQIQFFDGTNNYAASILSTGEIVPGGGNVLDLAGLTAATPSPACFSLRKLSSSYSGKVMRIRRSSDNAEADVAFDGVAVTISSVVNITAVGTSGLTIGNTMSLETFYAATSCYVTKWYDQSGNGRDAVQATTSKQPRFVNNGVPETVNGQLSMYYAFGSLQNLVTANYTAYNTAAVINAIAKVNAGGPNYNAFASKTGLTDPNKNYPAPIDFYYNVATGECTLVRGNGTAPAADFRTSTAVPFNPTVPLAVWTYRGSDDSASVYYNGIKILTSTVSFPSFNDDGSGLYIGTRADGAPTNVSIDGWISEVLTFTSMTGNQLVAVQNNQMPYFNLDSPVVTAGAVTGGIEACTGQAFVSTLTQSFTIQGAYLNNNITITPPAGFEISQTVGGASGYTASPIVLSKGTVNTIPTLTIYVRLASLAVAGSFSGNVTITGDSAITLAVAGTVGSTSAAPTTIIGTSTICAGSSTTLTVSGGTLSSGASAVWYEGAACGAFTENWSAFAGGYSLNVTTRTQQGGFQNLVSTSNDPSINMSGLGSFNPAEQKYINIRYKVNSGTAGSAEIFFFNALQGSANPSQQVNGTLISDGAWHVLSINMATHPLWANSNITGWRYDWATASGVNMDVDYISLTATPVSTGLSSGVVSPSVTTTYFARYEGLCGTTTCASQVVTVNQLPTASAGGTQTICQTGTALVSGATSANGTISWTENGSGSITSGNTSLTPVYTADAGDAGLTRTLTMTVTSTAGCSPAATATYSVVVDPLPTASAGGSQTICQTGTATVSGATSSNGTIDWTENGSGSITSGNTTLTPVYTAAAGDAGLTRTLTMTVTSNNSCGAATATASYLVPVLSTGTWTGTTNTDWHTAGNWCGGIPTSTTDITIPTGGGFYPTIANTPIAEVRNVTMAGSSTLAISATGTLQVHGNWANAGTFTPNTGTVEFMGGTQALANTNSGTESFYNLTKSGSGTLTVNSNSEIKANGTLTVSSGTLDVAASKTMILRSVAPIAQVDQTARLANVTGTITGTSTFEVERYIGSPSSRTPYNYGAGKPAPSILLSPSVKSLTASQWTDNIQTNFGTSTSSLAFYSELNGTGATVQIRRDRGWRFVMNSSTPLVLGKGYRMAVGIDNSDDLLSVTGFPQVGSLSVPVTYTTAGTQGLNLLGNPYACEIDFDAFYTANSGVIGSTMYIMDPYNTTDGGTTYSNIKYLAYNSPSSILIDPRVSTTRSATTAKYIPSSQGFFVEASTSGNVSFTEVMKATAPTSVYGNFRLEDEKELIRLNVTDVNNQTDQAVVHFRADASEAFDKYDAPSLSSGIYTLASGRSVVINGIPTLQRTTRVPLVVSKTVLGKKRLKVVEHTLHLGDLYLKDNYLNKMTLLSPELSYEFEYTSDTSSSSANRFVLVGGSVVTGIDDEKESSSRSSMLMRPNPFSHGVLNITLNNLKSEGSSQIEILSSSGELVYTEKVLNDSELEIELEKVRLSSGVYVVRYITPSKTFIERLVIVQ